MSNDFTRVVISKGSPLTSHPSGVGRLHTGCCLKGSTADPVLIVTLARKRNLLVVRRRGGRGTYASYDTTDTPSSAAARQTP
ncbi:MAG: hypothetical protein LBK25_05640 [Treponema sp.]|nr:hypothetical protein [Treponema sp.]